MSLRTAREVGAWIAEGARQSYASDHTVDPTIFFVGESGEALVMHPGPRYQTEPPPDPSRDTWHPTDIYADIAFRVGPLYPWRFIATATESWMQRRSPTETKEHPHVRRGTLEQLAEAGDPSVTTSVLTCVVRLDNHMGSYAEMSNVEHEDPLEWSITGVDGLMQGDMMDYIIRAHAEGSKLIPDEFLPLPEAPLRIIAESIAAAGVGSPVVALQIEE